jgi:hypothetical protein
LHYDAAHVLSCRSLANVILLFIVERNMCGRYENWDTQNAVDVFAPCLTDMTITDYVRCASLFKFIIPIQSSCSVVPVPSFSVLTCKMFTDTSRCSSVFTVSRTLVRSPRTRGSMPGRVENSLSSRKSQLLFGECTAAGDWS